MSAVVARAPGRVNLIGDHTDYTGGWVLPMAIDRWTTVEGSPGGDRVHLGSRQLPGTVDLPLAVVDPRSATPSWGRYVAGVIEQVRPQVGFRGWVASDVPLGSGLSSSAALEVAVALALGDPGPPLELAQRCRTAEHRATGVPCGIMDQLVIAAAVEGCALLIDCRSLDVVPVGFPPDAEVVVVHIAPRTLDGSEYATRVDDCRRAEEIIGPLRDASPGDVEQIIDTVIRARAEHVVGENRRVLETVAALQAGDLATAGRLMVESHASLRDLFATSTPAMDAAVARLCAQPGVYGARMTGGGFGGCVVALCQPGALAEGFVVRPVGAASISPSGADTPARPG
ncbi:MAG: galactokinase [Ilumatobacteraceae bacterium]